MQVKLVDAEGTELTLPEGFGITDLSPTEVSLAIQSIIGRNGSSIEPVLSAAGAKNLVIKGRLMDKDLIDAGSFQAARAAVLEDYFEILGFLNNARNLGAVKIYRESGVVVDPAAEGYDADLAPLGYHLLGYYKGGSAPTYWGGFGNAILDLTLNFTCPRPFWQGYFNIGSTAGNVGGGGAALSVPFSVVGSVPARPQIVLYSAAGLSVETGKKVTLSIGSLSLDWTGSIPAAGYVVFDCASGQAFSSEAMPAEGAVVWDGDTTTNKAAGLLDTSDWASRQWAFPTGDYALSVSSDQTAAAAITAYIRFSNEYYG